MPTLSDYNEYGVRSKKVATSQLFADLNLSMPVHPVKKDITPLTDIDAVKSSVKNLVLTNFGEKLFRPEFGGNVTSYLFENVDIFTALSIQGEIERVLSRFEPRVTDVTVQVDDEVDDNDYNVTIGFKIINNPQEFTVDFALNRLR